jgi:thiol-disulfide isomerase/thioredoxin
MSHEQRAPLKPIYQLGILVAISVVLIGVLVLVIVASDDSSPTTNTAQSFRANQISDAPINLEDYHGQVVMLNFWATWCPPCRAEMPTIEAVYDVYKDQGFEVLAINVSEPASLVVPFVEEHQLSFPIVMDPNRELQRQYNVNSYPTSIFISPDGEIVARHEGIISGQQMVQYMIEAGTG